MFGKPFPSVILIPVGFVGFVVSVGCEIVHLNVALPLAPPSLAVTIGL